MSKPISLYIITCVFLSKTLLNLYLNCGRNIASMQNSEYFVKDTDSFHKLSKKCKCIKKTVQIVYSFIKVVLYQTIAANDCFRNVFCPKMLWYHKNDCDMISIKFLKRLGGMPL